ncbi:hypothetical protein [Streptomyces sp. NPDC005181]|uniref:hypothetical protein n=1 Tax=Streptomyces sp. NPDC005181 TaxID=3156869 RepID=UPI0033A0F367
MAPVAAVCILLGIASPADASYNTISATSGWQTVDNVTAGQTVDISASGSWTVDSSRDNELGGRVGPSGYSWGTDAIIGFQGLCHVIESGSYGTLIGQIGNGPVFLVESSANFGAQDSGPLKLRINDADACLGDNAGSVNVSVSIT